jgi:predicted CopG family antitoxin
MPTITIDVTVELLAQIKKRKDNKQSPSDYIVEIVAKHLKRRADEDAADNASMRETTRMLEDGEVE